MTATLTVQGLETSFFTRAATLRAVNGVSFSVRRGEIMGLVGESGSGKTVTGFSILGLVDPPGRIVGGTVMFDGRDLLACSEEEMRRIRGRRIAMIFQDPMMTLNPVLRIETQMCEAIVAHHGVSKAEARQRARDALGLVGIPSPDERLAAYPHQFSGGMRQRVAIAIALLNEPDLIVADEPTTALDVTIQGQILYEIRKLCRERQTSLIWITHDLSVVTELADTVAVMYAGKIIESGPIDEMINAPRHPYTIGLLDSTPARNVRGQPIKHIPGTTPSLLRLPHGCAFRPRCARATAACESDPPDLSVEIGRTVRCIHPALEIVM